VPRGIAADLRVALYAVVAVGRVGGATRAAYQRFELPLVVAVDDAPRFEHPSAIAERSPSSRSTGAAAKTSDATGRT